ncbi:MAG: SGNH/GDSL hydrolase family protein [Alphaproteobacteria bacterium]|nr:SGNH/GDSL hydrolase family protein [Alphaproteobacteria bacterium]
MPSFLKTTLLTLASIVFALALVEAAVRVAVDDGMQYDLEMWKYARWMKRVSAIPGAGHEHRPGAAAHLMGADLRINTTKQRGPEVASPKPAGVYRILMLGDSVTLGWGVAEADTTAARLEAVLNRTTAGGGKRVEVVNAGVGNYNTAMEAAWFLAEGRRLEPDLVVLNYFINDAEETPHRKGGPLREYSAAFVYFWGRLDSLQRRFLGASDWRRYYRGLYAPDRAGWRQVQAKIAELASYCRKHGLPLVLVNYPELRQLSPYPFADVSAKLATLARKLDIPYLDLLASVAGAAPASLWVTPEDAHPNALADARFATAIGSWLRDRIER